MRVWWREAKTKNNAEKKKKRREMEMEMEMMERDRQRQRQRQQREGPTEAPISLTIFIYREDTKHTHRRESGHSTLKSI